MLTEVDLSHVEMQKAERQGLTCQECGAGLTVAWGGAWGHEGYVLRCANNIEHQGLRRDFELTPAQTPGFTLYDAGKKRRRAMEKQHGKETMRALAKYEGVAVINRDMATEIVEALWGDAPLVEKAKAIMVCACYNLNPLMRHIYLVKYNRWDSARKQVVGEDWALIQGIQATRLLARRSHNFAYLDMTPRRATKEEVDKILGDTAKATHVYAFCHIRDLDTGAEAFGLKGRAKDESVKGAEKGNTPLNMACLQAERQALEYLYPAEMPAGIEVADERFIDAVVEEQPPKVTVTVVEGEPAVIEPEEAGVEGEAEAAGQPLDSLPLPEGFIDPTWLAESIQTLQAKKLANWTDAKILAALQKAYNVTGDTVLGAIQKLDKGQANQFAATIENTLRMV